MISRHSGDERVALLSLSHNQFFKFNLRITLLSVLFRLSVSRAVVAVLQRDSRDPRSTRAQRRVNVPALGYKMH